jgi:hypothetical protein
MKSSAPKLCSVLFGVIFGFMKQDHWWSLLLHNGLFDRDFTIGTGVTGAALRRESSTVGAAGARELAAVGWGIEDHQGHFGPGRNEVR